MEHVDNTASLLQTTRDMSEPILERNLTVANSVGNRLFGNMICANMFCLDMFNPKQSFARKGHKIVLTLEIVFLTSHNEEEKLYQNSQQQQANALYTEKQKPCTTLFLLFL